ENVGAAMRLLADAGLTTREACGNTVRNVTACPLAGICPGEAFDVTPYALGVSRYLLRHPDFHDLPRKFKIAFSGCENDGDCAVWWRTSAKAPRLRQKHLWCLLLSSSRWLPSRRRLYLSRRLNRQAIRNTIAGPSTIWCPSARPDSEPCGSNFPRVRCTAIKCAAWLMFWKRKPLPACE